MSQLLSPLKIRALTFRNRIFMAPMCQYSAADDGRVKPWHLVHYGSRATGGVGAVIVEATAVSAIGRISIRDLGLWNLQQAEALQAVTEFVRGQGAVAGVQLAHAGRKASSSWQGLAPSALSFSDAYPVPHALSESEIADITGEFAHSAKLALVAGFEMIELHCAHGYLLHEFLSPLSNRREDRYGGSLENRMRLPLEVIKAVRAAIPEGMPLFVRVSATDWVAGGWDLEQTVAFANRMREEGVDFIDCSSGALVSSAQIPVAPGYQVPLAREVRARSGLRTGAVGLITEPAQAEKILGDGSADAILLGRELLRNPHWPLQAAKSLGDDVQWPDQYARAK